MFWFSCSPLYTWAFYQQPCEVTLAQGWNPLGSSKAFTEHLWKLIAWGKGFGGVTDSALTTTTNFTCTKPNNI